MSCNSSNKNPNEDIFYTEDQMDSIVGILKSKIHVQENSDTILLGYHFGMSKDQFSTHTESLISQNKVDDFGPNFWNYEIETENENLPTIEFSYSASFFQDSLRTIYVNHFFKNYPLFRMTVSELKKILIAKYGNPNFTGKMLPKVEDTVTGDIWVKNNTLIYLVSNKIGVRITYRDYSHEQAILDSINQEKEIKRINTVNSF